MKAGLNFCIIREFLRLQYIKRRIQKREIDSQSLLKFLRSCGLLGKSKVFIHGSISQLKKDGNAKQLANTLFDNPNIDEIFLPTFTPSFQNSRVFSLLHSRSEVGALGDVQNWKFQKRTPDPLHSVRILTRQPAKLPSFDFHSTFSSEGFFASTLDDVVVLNINTYRFLCTYLHVFEEMMEVPYKRTGGKVFDGVMYDESNNACEIRHRSHSNLLQSEFARAKLESFLLKHGAMQIWNNGNNEVSISKMSAVRELVIEKLRTNPLFLVT